MIEEERVQQAVKEILMAIGEDLSRDGLKNTPTRVSRMYSELFSGIGLDPTQAIDSIFGSEESGSEGNEYGGMVILRDVPFFSTCEHHLLPFFGKAHMGYIPNGGIAGASKLARALDVVSHRLQVQERMTNQLADAIFHALDPDGVAVMVEAEHLCMLMRGIKKQGSMVITTAMRGPFLKGVANPGDLMALIQRR